MKCKYLSTVLAAVLAAVPFVVDGFTAYSMLTRDGRRMVSYVEGTNTVYELVPTNRLPANLPPVREWKLYGLKATHTDIGLHNSQYIQRHGTVKRIDQAARLIDADTRADDDPAAYRYVMEGAWFWDNYHQDKGRDAAWRIVTNYMARGRMDVGVTCAGNHTHLFSETEIDRSTLTKKYLADTWGIGTKTFLMADNPGISCSVIAPYVRAGIKYGLFLPNQWNPIPSTIWKKNTDIMSATWNPDAMGGGARVEVSYDSPLPMVFRWKAPGRDESLLMWCSTQYGYGYSRLGLRPGYENRLTVASVEARMPSFLQILERKYPYDVWLAATYSDDETPNTKFADFAAAWNEKWAWPQFRTVGRLDEPFEYLEKNFGDKIPTLTGEMTSGWLQHAASTPELFADKLNADRMLETAERLGTFAGTIDRAAVDRAWWYLILNDEHSYGTSGYKGRRVFETWMQHRDWIERAAATASNELAKAVAKLGLNTGTTGVQGTSTPCRNGITENRWYRVVVTNGVIYSIYDKELGRELLDGPANRFLYTRDNHKTWEAHPDAALGAQVTRRVFLPSDAKRIDIEDRFGHARDLFNSRRYYRYGYLAFPFAVPDGAFTAHLNGTVIRPYEDCHPMSSDAYCAVRDWCAVENDAFGVALMMRDSTLTEFGEIHPDKTCYTGRPPCGKTAIYPYIFTDWLQMHQPDGDSMNFSFRFSITSYAGGWKAADVPRTCAAWLDPYAEWMRAHNVPHVARDAVAEPPPGWTGLIEKPRAGHGEKDGQMYVLWGAEMSPDFSHYELWRDGTFLANVTNEVPDGIPYRVARYEDLGLPTHSRHEYRIRKVWKDGRKDTLGAPFFGLTRFVSAIEAAPIKIRVGAGTPNATIDAALEKVAAIRRKDTQTPIEVRIAPGDYAMDRQLMITRKHANTNWAELTVRADDFDRKPRLFGARDVKGWAKVRFNGRDDVWMADVSALKLGKTSRLFFLDGRRMQPARWPNAVSGEPYGGCARALDDGIQMWQSPRFCNMGVYIDEIRFRPGEARSWSKPEYGWVIAWPRHNWWNAVYSIKCVSNDLVRLDAPHDEIRDRLFPWDRWRAENILEELDAPGEWYHDIGEHRLYFIPPGGIDPNAARTTVAHGAAVLSIAGGNVAIEGLEILNGAGGLNISSADRVRVSGCSIHDVGFFRESAVHVRGHHVRIEDCDVFNTGGNGIFLGSYGKECRVDDRMDVVIENNHVHHCGEVYSHGIGIWIGGQGVRVSHNLIHDMPRCGLFGYGRFNEISYNRIRQVNLVNDDTGAIYGGGWTDGVGTKVCYNHISHSIGYQRTRDGSYVTHSGAHGIYPDEGCGGLEIFGNLVDHCNGVGAHLHNGRWITISNNVFVSNAPRASSKGAGGQLSLSSWNNLTNDYFVCHRRAAISKQYHGLVDNDPRWLSFPSLAQAPDKDSTAFNADGSTMMGVRVVNNIFYYPDQGKTDLVRGRRHFSIPDNPFNRNVYWSGNPTNITFRIGTGYDWKTWREAGQDADSVLADPMFIDPANGDYRLRPGSPALARGFKEIPYAEIGLRRTKFRKKLR